ncbi:MAG: class I SAM-dependent methyltransferase [Rhodothermales bacterium]|nr:class I SAM-dependent methyltransferase [Rhodothermales bacterium]
MDPDYYRLVAAVEDEHWWYVARRRILSRVLLNLRLAAGARILDAGCGTGGNLQMLSQHGRVSAFEMEPYSREVAAGKRFGEVLTGSLPDDIPFDAATFDVVTALDVIEHIENDAGALRAIRGLLVPGGTLILTVPAYQFLWSSHDEVNHHCRRYTLSGVTDTLRKAGFDTVHATYFNTWLFPAIAATRLVGRVLPRSGQRSDLRLPPRIVNRLLTVVFGSEAWITSTHTLPFGVSILVVARPRP